MKVLRIGQTSYYKVLSVVLSRIESISFGKPENVHEPFLGSCLDIGYLGYYTDCLDSRKK